MPKKILIFILLILVFINPLSNIGLVFATSSPWSQSDWSTGNYSSVSNTTTSTANQVTLTKSEKLSNTGFESDLTGWSSSVTSFADSTFNAVSGAVAAWPLDDTTTTQSYSRVLNPALATGRNVILNGTFDDSSIWSAAAGMSISGGVAHFTSASTLSSNTATTVIGKAYSVTFTISNYSAGNFRMRLGTASGVGTSRSANGTFTENIIAAGSTVIYMDPTGFTGDIDNVSVTQINLPASSSTPTQLLTDGDMETSGVAAWTPTNATLTKVTTTQHGGDSGQVLHIVRTGSSGFASQTVLTVGKTYRVTGFARGDGTNLPNVYLSAAIWSGTTSTTWQPFDVVFVATQTTISLNGAATTGNYVEFDDVVVSEDTYIRTGELLPDNDMETSGTSFWTLNGGGTPALSKQTTNPHSGSQVLRVANGSAAQASAQQIILATGKTYRVTGYARSDGTTTPAVYDGSAYIFSGTTSTSWQAFDAITVAPTTSIYLSKRDTNIGYAEFDDVSITEVDPLVGKPLLGVTLGSASGGHLTNAYSFDGTNDNVNIYSSDLNSALNPSEGTIVLWAKVSGAGVWSDSTTRFLGVLYVDSNNSIQLYKDPSANTITSFYNASGTLKAAYITTSTTSWFQIVFTWSKSANQVKVFFNGTQSGATQTGLGTWTGNLNASDTVIGNSYIAASSGSWSGLINDVRVYNTALSDADILALYNGTTSARDTGTKYSGSASSKLVGAPDENGIFTQSVNVGDTSQYNLSAYAYTNGSAVTSSDASLYYNGSTVTTTYTSVGSGWYKLTGTVTGVASSTTAGVYIPAGKTVYVDDISLNNYPSSGSLTSSIYDSGTASNWGALAYSVTTPTNTTATVQVRSGNNSDLSDAGAFSSCNTISSGSTVGGTNCANNGTRYAQYLITLSSSDLLDTPTFTSFSLPFTTSFVVSLVGPGNNSYTSNQRPTFSWNKSDTTGGVVKYILEVNDPKYSIIVDNIPSARSDDLVTSKYNIHYDTNTVSFYTLSSSSWAESENDGKLHDGTTTWKVTAVDTYGNQTSATRTLYVDTTAPSLTNLSISGTTISGSVSDTSSGVGSVDIKIEKQDIFGNFNLYSDATLNINGSTFSFTPKVGLPGGVYKISVTASDKAGNVSEATITNLNISSFAVTKTPAPTPTVTPAPSATPLATPSPTTFKISLPKISFNIGDIFTPIANFYINLAVGIQKFDINLASNIFNSISNLYSSYSNFVFSTNDKMLASINSLGNLVDTGVNNIGLEISNKYQSLAMGASGFAKTFLVSLGNGVNAARVLISNTSLAIGRGINGIGNGARDMSNTIATFGNSINNTLSSMGVMISNQVFNIGEKAQNLSDKLGFAIIQFTYNLIHEPTKISDIKVAIISSNSVKISWQTNQPATGEVDYGLDRTYSFQVQSSTLTKNHEFVLTDLKPDTVYSFEVMSQGKNYVYNANREFRTPKE